MRDTSENTQWVRKEQVLESKLQYLSWERWKSREKARWLGQKVIKTMVAPDNQSRESADI